ncbi:trypsin-like peptidase domain-containing protein [Labrys monachus]|uniref:Uncharacterized protein n=1 Tax=Labrys monachus TaxID=217067 RepID=A0ABU0FC86_9HYPH|nr:trypsin-like peptidase domain-containing protein [Labrys monachus]MDQ0392231.1 hypothetical protein [Labrys monachus]
MFAGDLDIAAVQLCLPIDQRNGKPIRMPANKLGLGLPRVGETCFALGYHAMTWGGDEQLHQVHQNFAASRGIIEELHVPTRDRHSLNFPCFRTSARYDGGMSGGPVLGEDGLVRGVVCSSMKLDGEETGHISYASLIAPAMLLVVEARDGHGVVAQRFLWEFVESGAIAADTAGIAGGVSRDTCRLEWGGGELVNRLGT